jgi:hypothetical protein
MSYLRIPLALLALVTIFGACCCGLIGNLIGGVEFTAGDFSDVPPYPNATQTTESSDAINAMTMVFKLIPGEAEWKHYTTGDSEDDVLEWYKEQLPRHGWDEASSEDIGQVQTEGGAFFVKDNTMLVIFAAPNLDDTGDTHILIGRIVMEEE